MSRRAAWRWRSSKRPDGRWRRAPGRRRRSRMPTATRTTRSSWSSTAAGSRAPGRAARPARHGGRARPARHRPRLRRRGPAHPGAGQPDRAGGGAARRHGGARRCHRARRHGRGDDDPMGPGAAAPARCNWSSPPTYASAGRRMDVGGSSTRCSTRCGPSPPRCPRPDAGLGPPRRAPATTVLLRSGPGERRWGCGRCRCGARSSGSRWPRRCSHSARRNARRHHHRRPPPRRGRTSTATCPTTSSAAASRAPCRCR